MHTLLCQGNDFLKTKANAESKSTQLDKKECVRGNNLSHSFFGQYS